MRIEDVIRSAAIPPEPGQHFATVPDAAIPDDRMVEAHDWLAEHGARYQPVGGHKDTPPIRPGEEVPLVEPHWEHVIPAQALTDEDRHAA
ncbi:MAG: hypothetical protein M0P31_18275 [Solirubrobacteraceae bacterium]|nr:hypothetical protein [Solirubrobacteraceae bacterium]